MQYAPSIPTRLIMRLPVGRDAVLRVWNRVERLRGARKVKTYFNQEMMCDPVDIIQSTITHFGVWEPSVSLVFERFIRDGDYVLDIGANIGYYTLLASKMVGKSGRVLAIEAHPLTAGKLRENLRLNAIDNVNVEECALSEMRGRVSLYEAPSSNVGMTTIRANAGFSSTITVDAKRLLDIVPIDLLANITFIKCDIEGAELPVMDDILDNCHILNDRLSIIVETDNSNNGKWYRIYSRFVDNGFKAYLIPNRLELLWHNLLYNKVDTAAIKLDNIPAGISDILFTRLDIDCCDSIS